MTSSWGIKKSTLKKLDHQLYSFINLELYEILYETTITVLQLESGYDILSSRKYSISNIYLDITSTSFHLVAMTALLSTFFLSGFYAHARFLPSTVSNLPGTLRIQNLLARSDILVHVNWKRWLVVSIHLKNISQIGSFPPIFAVKNQIFELPPPRKPIAIGLLLQCWVPITAVELSTSLRFKSSFAWPFAFTFAGTNRLNCTKKVVNKKK